jgi:glycosyltransferase involved in cell wall biosynthesis
MLRHAVASVLPQLMAGDELLVVDNGSTDGTPELMAALTGQNPAVRVCHEAQPGTARARNRALAEAHSEVVVYFDDDELAEAGWLQVFRDFFSTPEGARAGGAGGPYIAQQVLPPPEWLEPRYGAYDLQRPRQIVTGISAPAGGNLAVRRDAARTVGGFCTGLRRREDVELTRRLQAAGYEVWWLPEARVRHVIPPERYRLRVQLRLWWLDGRDAFLMRLDLQPIGWRRYALRLGRILLGPVQLLVQGLGAGTMLLLWRRRTAARLFLRMARTVGTIVQACSPTPKH